MDKKIIPLNEYLLQLANPKYWGEKYYIKLRSGEAKVVILKRINWTMKYGKVIGYCLIIENGKDIQIEIAEIVDITTDLPQDIKNDLPIPEKRTRVDTKVLEQFKKFVKHEVAV